MSHNFLLLSDKIQVFSYFFAFVHFYSFLTRSKNSSILSFSFLLFADKIQVFVYFFALFYFYSPLTRSKYSCIFSPSFIFTLLWKDPNIRLFFCFILFLLFSDKIHVSIYFSLCHFYSSLTRSKYSSIFSLSFIFTPRSAETTKFGRWHVLFFWLINTIFLNFWLALGDPFVNIPLVSFVKF